MAVDALAGDLPSGALRFERVFAECGPFVWRVLTKLGVSPADVPDLCQEVFVVVHRRLGDFDGRGSVRSWIYGICVKRASSYRRRHPGRREIAIHPLPDRPGDGHTDELLDRKRAKAYLDSVLSQLEDEKREVFVLFELEELPMQEVADALGCPLQTAYSRLYAARKSVIGAFRRLHAKEVRT